MSEKKIDHADEARQWVGGAEEGLAEAWEGDEADRADTIATQQVAATLALVHETARLADAQERTAAALEAANRLATATEQVTATAKVVQIAQAIGLPQADVAELVKLAIGSEADS